MLGGEPRAALVSIVVPAYHSEAYLPEVLADIVGQTHPTLELLVVDDGSTDGTARLADRLAGQDERVSVIHTSNHGPSHARNVGTALAGGAWIWFVDADDRIAGDAVERLLTSAATHDSEVAVANMLPFDEHGLLPRTHCLPEPFPPQACSDGQGLLANILRCALGGYPWQFFMRSHVLRGLSPEGAPFPDDIRLYEDVVFSTRLAQSVRRVSYVDRPLYYYRQTPSSTAQRLGPTALREGLAAIELVEGLELPQELTPLRNECLSRLYLYLYGSREGGREMAALRRAIKGRLLRLWQTDTDGLSRTVRVKALLLRLNLLRPATSLVRRARAAKRQGGLRQRTDAPPHDERHPDGVQP